MQTCHRHTERRETSRRDDVPQDSQFGHLRLAKTGYLIS